MKRPKIIIKRNIFSSNWYYQIVAKNGRVLAMSDRPYSSRMDAIRGAKDLIKTCLIMFNNRKVRVLDANGKKIIVKNSPS